LLPLPLASRMTACFPEERPEPSRATRYADLVGVVVVFALILVFIALVVGSIIADWQRVLGSPIPR
jgi:hypothetical protein